MWRDTEGNILTDKTQILKRWAERFYDLLNKNKNFNSQQPPKIIQRKIVMTSSPPKKKQRKPLES
jgi:hypothetical protein